ncbi:exodeoxyribonuclease III [Synechococcus sp. CS-1325]|uniref:exodeoxyribonuclease III n=1 Tax=Synechococcus sp. CS-1325 TaxID=2847979 RepID=UPI000DB83D8B|nr:exodeoxyribonuclease III [Synechococcus sp. CS-1325]MCT0200342.1 exodeoxyribonuclease III [Synechococcus sp. CS-1325]PZU99674.1 MAG: exodeoxyribonuclease III [Cyanobium sp.]
MRIATWNVNSVRTRLAQVLAWLERQNPDLLCLQETKVEDRLFPAEAFRSLGYDVAISGQKAYNGVALLSRLPLEDVQVGLAALLPEDADARRLSEQKRVISARVAGVRVLNLYVPNGSGLGSEKYGYKLEWLACLGRYLAVQAERGEELCVLGDFNIALEDRDIHDPARLSGGIMASTAERQALQAALGGDLHDVFRLFEPAGNHWSWWDYRSGAWDRDRGWRIDHIYLSESLLAWATGCAIDKVVRGQEQPSDHAPVLVNLQLPEDDDDNDNDNDDHGDGDDHGADLDGGFSFQTSPMAGC